MIAFHYPPARGSSGIQRTLCFSKYLRDSGWEPIVLTAKPTAYPRQGADQLEEIPNDICVKRAFAVDTARHLAWRGKYAAVMAYPDRWVSWWAPAVSQALQIIKRHRPCVLWSTYPIATAHMIGLTVSRMTSIPWVADFRDSMTEDEYPEDKCRRKVFRWIEKSSLRRAASAVFTAPGTLEMYKNRYGTAEADRWRCIQNGYDEESFPDLDGKCIDTGEDPDTLVLLHSGLLYLSERDPRSFFEALRTIKSHWPLEAARLQVRLRASGFEDRLTEMIDEAGIADIVELAPAVEYRAALQEICAADGLLLFQASNCNHQIPAKLYEYLRSRRPILALTDPQGDTASVLRRIAASTIVPIDNREAITSAIRSFVRMIKQEDVPKMAVSDVAKFSRRQRTRELAELFDSLVE